VSAIDATAPAESESRDFKASDLLQLAGLTYRQLHDWENRAGVLSSQRATAGGWRKFTVEQVLALCVCASLRRQFSVALEKLGRLLAWLLNAPPNSTDGIYAQRAKQDLQFLESEVAPLHSLTGEELKQVLADDRLRFIVSEYIQAKRDSWRECPIRYAARCIEQGETVYLYTDLTTSLILFEQNMANAIVERFPSGPVIILPLNSVLDELRTAAGKALLPRDKLAKPLSARWRDLQNRIQITENEREVLLLIREKTYQRVTVHLNDGRIVRADVEEDLSKSDAAKRDAQILRAIKEKDFSTVAVQKANGQIVRLTRKSTVKFDKVTGRT
jgi:DNA-binding transcriptional MerR regulator